MKTEIHGTLNGPGEVLVVTLEVGDKAMSPEEVSRSTFHGVHFSQIEFEGQTKDGYQYHLTRSKKSRESEPINIL